MRLVKLFAFLALLLIAIAGCGGSGGGGNTFAGSYQNSFFRGGIPDTEILIVIAYDGSTSVVISDAGGVLYHGTGTTTSSGVITATASSDTATVDVAGTCSKGFIDVSLSNAISNTVELHRFDLTTMPFAGKFSGGLAGDEDGTEDLTINSKGEISGVVHRNLGDMPIDGSIDQQGNVTMTEHHTLGDLFWTGQVWFNMSGTLHGSGVWNIAGGGYGGTWNVNPS